jgi:hypothetical protein
MKSFLSVFLVLVGFLNLKLTAQTNFTYTGNLQTFTVPYTDTYKLEIWGAKSGDEIGFYGSDLLRRLLMAISIK